MVEALPSTLGAVLAMAVERHQAGRLAEAAALYRSALISAPENSDAMHLLGLTEWRSGNLLDGLLRMGRAQGLCPGDGNIRHNLGNAWLQGREATIAHLQGGQLDEAAAFRRILDRLPVEVFDRTPFTLICDILTLLRGRVRGPTRQPFLALLTLAERNPDHRRSLLWIFFLLLDQEDIPEAATIHRLYRLARAMHRANPHEPFAIGTIAFTLYWRNRVATLTRFLEATFASLDPERITAQYPLPLYYNVRPTAAFFAQPDVAGTGADDLPAVAVHRLDTDGVTAAVVFGCDDVYWRNFGRSALRSLVAGLQGEAAGLAVHLHIVDPSPQTLEEIGLLSLVSRPLRINLTSEQSRVPHRLQKHWHYKLLYYMCARLMRMPWFMERYRCPVAEFDVDAVFIGDVRRLIDRVAHLDAACLAGGRSSPTRIFAAGMCFFNATPDGRRFADLVARHITYFMTRDVPLYFLDQTALYSAYHALKESRPGFAFQRIDDALMASVYRYVTGHRVLTADGSVDEASLKDKTAELEQALQGAATAPGLPEEPGIALPA